MVIREIESESCVNTQQMRALEFCLGNALRMREFRRLSFKTKVPVPFTGTPETKGTGTFFCREKGPRPLCFGLFAFGIWNVVRIFASGALIFVAAGCQKYHPQPIDPDAVDKAVDRVA